MIDVAHIYPHHSLKQREEGTTGPRHDFWSYLRTFWSEEKVTAWEARLFPQGICEKGVEEVYNLISLSPSVHRAWGRGLFALKPISESDDKKTLIVQFFWQEKQIGALPGMSLTTTPISTQGLKQTAGIWLFDKNEKKIQSGDCFALQTDDPIQKPLPSFELLELQWALHRIQGMAGAADVDWEASDSDNEIEEAPSLDDDVEDFSLVSEESLCSPAKPNHPCYPKHVTAEVEVEGQGDRNRVSDFVM
jgi:hypothetical protein